MQSRVWWWLQWGVKATCTWRASTIHEKIIHQSEIRCLPRGEPVKTINDLGDPGPGPGCGLIGSKLESVAMWSTSRWRLSPGGPTEPLVQHQVLIGTMCSEQTKDSFHGYPSTGNPSNGNPSNGNPSNQLYARESRGPLRPADWTLGDVFWRLRGHASVRVPDEWCVRLVWLQIVVATHWTHGWYIWFNHSLCADSYLH